MWVKWTIGSWQELQASRRGYHPPSNVDTQPHVAEHRCHRTPSMRGVVRRPVTAVDRGRWHWPAALQWRHVATGVGQRGPAISGMGGWMGDGWTDGMGSYHGHGKRVRLLPNRRPRPGQAEQTIKSQRPEIPRRQHPCLLWLTDEPAASRASGSWPSSMSEYQAAIDETEKTRENAALSKPRAQPLARRNVGEFLAQHWAAIEPLSHRLTGHHAGVPFSAEVQDSVGYRR